MLPGIGPAMTVALLLPITYGLEPTGAMIMLAGIFYGGMYGGSTTSILLNTPGESSSVVTAIEGNLMAKAGQAAQALATAAIGSFVAGTIGTTLLVFFAPLMTRFADLHGSAGVLRGHPAGLHRRHRGARSVPVARLHRPGARSDASAWSGSTRPAVSPG